MFRLRLLAMVVLVCLLTAALTIQAQENTTCPSLVQQALQVVGNACSGLGRNQVCYGNNAVKALDWNGSALPHFAMPGDLSSIVKLASLQTAPLNLDDRQWGVAVLAVQADLPDTLPGQNVVFVLYGDAQLTSDELPPGQSLAPVCPVIATSGANLRSGPGTNYTVVGKLGTGDSATANGRSSAGDWLRIDADGKPAWVSAALVAASGCDLSTLVEVGVNDTAPITGYDAPMQAMRLSTGIGRTTCEAAPRAGLLIQSPSHTTVHFLINGVQVKLGSTALVQFDHDVMGINTLDGLVSVTSDDKTQTAGTGLRIDVMQKQPPAAPVIYTSSDVANAPVSLLPEEVHIQRPPPSGSDVGVLACSANGGATRVSAGQPLVFRLGWADLTAEAVRDFADAVTNTATINGQPIDLWSSIGPAPNGNQFVLQRYWVVSDPAPGQYNFVVDYAFSRPVNELETNSIISSLPSLRCTVTVG